MLLMCPRMAQRPGGPEETEVGLEGGWPRVLSGHQCLSRYVGGAPLTARQRPRAGSSCAPLASPLSTTQSLPPPKNYDVALTKMRYSPSKGKEGSK